MFLSNRNILTILTPDHTEVYGSVRNVTSHAMGLWWAGRGFANEQGIACHRSDQISAQNCCSAAMAYEVVNEGDQALLLSSSGSGTVIIGPRRVSYKVPFFCVFSAPETFYHKFPSSILHSSKCRLLVWSLYLLLFTHSCMWVWTNPWRPCTVGWPPNHSIWWWNIVMGRRRTLKGKRNRLGYRNEKDDCMRLVRFVYESHCSLVPRLLVLQLSFSPPLCHFRLIWEPGDEASESQCCFK